MNKYQKKYLKIGYKKVNGWFSEGAISLISYLLKSQDVQKIAGSVLEIGVHHGRSFILLSLFTKKNEHAVAIDLFENQSENIDKSGCGDREIFESNLKRFNPNQKNVKIIQQNSTTLLPEDLVGCVGQKYRFLSIDGGHTAEIVYSDLSLANSILVDGGIVLLDDYFDQNWPGVSEGTLKFLIQPNHNLIPFAIFDDKVLLTNNPKLKNEYIKALLANRPEFIFKHTEFLGQNCLICYSSSSYFSNQIRKSFLWQKIKDTRFANVMRTLAHYL